jgi:hypothetical protein
MKASIVMLHYNTSKVHALHGVCLTTFCKLYGNIFSLYRFETWSVTVREEQRLKVFEKRVLKGLFGPKGEVEHRKDEKCICILFGKP